MSHSPHSATPAVRAALAPLPARPVDPSRVVYRLEARGDAMAVEAIAEEAFGPGRYVRAAERVRELHPQVSALSFVAEYEDAIIGSVRMTDMGRVRDASLMLGPLAVRPQLKGVGIGKALMRRAASEAKTLGFRAIYLVGDSPYYALLGYRMVEDAFIELPRPVDRSRLLVLDL